jgi:hypothetical protein
VQVELELAQMPLSAVQVALDSEHTALDQARTLLEPAQVVLELARVTLDTVHIALEAAQMALDAVRERSLRVEQPSTLLTAPLRSRAVAAIGGTVTCQPENGRVIGTSRTTQAGNPSPECGSRKQKAMNQYQENRMSMFYAVQRTLAEHNAVWSGTPAIVTAAADLDGKVARLQSALEVQLRDITGHAVDKANAEEAMIAETLDVAGKVRAYAVANANEALAEAMNISPSELRRYRDSVVAQRCQDVHDAANGVLASLAGYGVDAAKLLAFQALIDGYLAANTAPRLAITARADATATIEALTSDTLDLLHRQMDPLMQGYALSNPSFFRLYTNARVIVDLGGGGEEEEPVPPTP